MKYFKALKTLVVLMVVYWTYSTFHSELDLLILFDNELNLRFAGN